jgi:hypothetical protein
MGDTVRKVVALVVAFFALENQMLDRDRFHMMNVRGGCMWGYVTMILSRKQNTAPHTSLAGNY